MNISKIYGKLRKGNIGNYRLITGCIFFSILLISAFAVMMQSHTIQTILPEGGDSRKQMYLIFGIAVFGCLVFSVYAASLFFKSKSKEMGVMMAIGAPKHVLARLLMKDVAIISIISSVAGAVLALPLAAGIWQLFKLIVANTDEMVFSVDFSAYIWSGVFALVCIMILFFLAARFLSKSNIIDIVNDQRKSEMVKDVKSWYGWVGIILMVVGAFFGYMKSDIFISLLDMLPPIWSNAIFLLIPLGLYMFSVYIIVRSKKGKHKYNNIISKSIMKFQGRQTVRNMCVVALLLVGGLFATFYVPTMLTGIDTELNSRDYNFEYKYAIDEDIPSGAEIDSLANKNGLNITRYKENSSIVLASDGVEKDFDENNKATEEYMERISEVNIISETDFNKISGQDVDVAEGKFAYIRPKGDNGSIYDYIDDITIFTNPTTEKVFKTSNQGDINYTHLLGYFVVNDADFIKYSAGLDSQWKEKMVWFDVDDYDNSFAFASELRNEIVKSSSSNVEVPEYYDRIAKAEAQKKGEEYWGDVEPDAKVRYSEKDSAKFKTEWKYSPHFKIIDASETMLNYAVYMLLFAFIAILCLAAVIIILYTRSITIAINNKQVFEDLKRLGGNRKYLRKSVKAMISTVYIVPTIIGSALIFAFYMMIMMFNSGNMDISASEQTAIIIDLGMIAGLSAILWVAYKSTMRRIYKILNM